MKLRYCPAGAGIVVFILLLTEKAAALDKKGGKLLASVGGVRFFLVPCPFVWCKIVRTVAVIFFRSWKNNKSTRWNNNLKKNLILQVSINYS